MRTGPMFFVGAALLVTACSENAGDERAPQPQGNPFNEQVKALDEPARNLAFRNAIRDFKARCERVDRSAYQDDVNNSAMWVARCTDTGDFAIFVTATGYAQVVRCEDLTGGNVPRCTALG